MSVVLGSKEFFKGIEKIKYEGTASHNPLAFRWYNEKDRKSTRLNSSHQCGAEISRMPSSA
jgi:xylose isomerase